MATEEKKVIACPICLEEEIKLDEMVCLPCSNFHYFHRACWKKVVDKDVCPVCKGALGFAQPDGEAVATNREYNLLSICNKLIRESKLLNPQQLRVVSGIYHGLINGTSIHPDEARVVMDIHATVTRSLSDSAVMLAQFFVDSGMSNQRSRDSNSWNRIEQRERERQAIPPSRRDLRREADIAVNQLNAEMASMFLDEEKKNAPPRRAEKPYRTCMRCHTMRPPTAFDPKKRICKQCRSREIG